MPESQPDPQLVAAHLRKPDGELGLKIAELMNEGNAVMNQHAFDRLEMEPGQHLLEIGMGNGGLIPQVLTQYPGIRYTGLDYAETMVEEAQARNRELIDAGTVQIEQGSIAAMPFADASFDRVLTVNTLYFWPEPEANMAEVYRVTKPGGRFILAIRPDDIMANIPVTAFNFAHFSGMQAAQLLQSAGYHLVAHTREEEGMHDVNGEEMVLAGEYLVGERPV